MLEKNKEYIGIVSNIGANGEGVVFEEGFVVFVPFAITGEKIRYKVLKTTQKVCYGKLVEVLQPSTIRVSPKCDVFHKCGGCQLQHILYSEQLKIKQNNIKNCFNKIANIDVCVEDAVVGKDCFRYRNKLQLPVQYDGEKNIFGFYSENSHRVIDIKDCLINPYWCFDIISAFSFFMEKFNLRGLNQQDFSGDIREITVKEIGENLLITVVGLKKELKCKDQLVLVLKEKLKNNFSLFYNYNNSTSNVIFSDEFSLIYGEKEYIAKMNNISYSIGVKSFSQVNNEVCEKLYKKVVESLVITKNSTVIDAYSGAGLMTAMIAQKAEKVIGIEIVDEAVEIANNLMQKNGLQDMVINHCGKCEDLLPDLIKKEKENNRSVSIVLDPPRKGCDYKVIESIINSNVDCIVYVSCMPSTLARDVGLLTGSLEYKDGEIVRTNNSVLRFNIKEIVPFEMFPNTKHIETVCVLIKN